MPNRYAESRRQMAVATSQASEAGERLKQWRASQLARHCPRLVLCNSYISVTVILAPLPLSTLVVLPLSVPAIPLHGVVPLSATSVVAPLVVSRTKSMLALPLARQVIPNVGSLTPTDHPMMLALMVNILGSVPVKLWY